MKQEIEVETTVKHSLVSDVLVTPEAAAAQGVNDSPAVVMINLTKGPYSPNDVHASNVRSLFKPHGGGSALCCQGVVTKEPLAGGERMVLSEFMAPLLGFSNYGFDDEHKPILVPVYGKPVLRQAWDVTVGPTAGQYVYAAMFHYADVIFYVVSELPALTPKPTATPETK